MGLAQLIGNKNWQIGAFSCAGFAAMQVTVQITIRVSLQLLRCKIVNAAWSAAALPHRSRSPQQVRFDRMGSIACGGLLGEWEQRLLMSRQRYPKSDAPIGDRPKVRTAFLTSSTDRRRGRSVSSSYRDPICERSSWSNAASKA